MRNKQTKKERERRITGEAVAEHFAEDLRAALLRVLILLEHHHRRALTHTHAVAVGAQRPQRLRRLVVVPIARAHCTNICVREFCTPVLLLLKYSTMCEMVVLCA